MKSIFQSKMVWFNLLAFATIVAGKFGFGEFMAEAWVNEAGIAAVVLINVLLRFKTTQGLKY